MKDNGTFELNEKLSEDDHAFLRSYWDVTSLQRNAQNLGVTAEAAQRAQFWTYEEYESHVAEAAETDEEPELPQNPPAAPGGSSDPVLANATNVAGIAGASVGAASAEPVPTRAFLDTDLAGKPYEEWTKEQLKAEIDKRNADRSDWENYEPMSASGNKPDLSKALSEDDAEDAAEAAEAE